MFDRKEMMEAFLCEANEELQKLEIEILALEQSGDSETSIKRIFRVAHTLKGSSAAMGFDEMKTLTHEMENVLDGIRQGRLRVSTELVNVLFACLDALNALRDDIEAEREAQTPTDRIVERLRAIGSGEAGAGGSAAGSGEPGHQGEGGGQAPFEVGEQDAAAIKQAEREGMQAYECLVKLADTCEMRLVRYYVVAERFNSGGQVIATIPELHMDLDVPELRFLVVSGLGEAELKAKIEQIMDVSKVSVARYALTEAPSSEPQIAVAAAAPEVRQAPGAAPVKEQEQKRSSQTIRVGVDRIENMMNLVGELVIDQTRITQLGHLLRDRYPVDENLEMLEQVANHFTRVIGELQESVMKTRMLPIGQLFNRFPRMMRDLSQNLNKDIHLIMEGEETELDRTVIEEIGDPLIHLLRNAIDHGIESKEARLASGKPLVGTVRMTAAHQENQVVLTVEDDGAGIDPERIKQSAVRKGLLTQQAADALTEQECIELVFMPGFSTASTISDVSGRGVGMDIVRNHIEKLNGLIDVQTKPGQGTTFIIKLPLTLAILRGLLVNLGPSTFALPMGSVVEIVRYSTRDIYTLKGQPVVKNRERVIPLLWLHDHFNLPRRKRTRDHVFVVVVGVAEKRIGLIVDELIGNQEIVVKSVGSYIGKIEGVSGATILGDGSVALILDVTGIFQLAGTPKKIGSAPDAE
ncbi:chemotaxis protein CheW [Paenibacillus aurantiacus]|uniref:Chemotaxis protein CheA n=1 Tax=Paenibacillus aurantiacus TaxID=1936118 RepID=A0ABV5KIR2_9BACL